MDTMNTPIIETERLRLRPFTGQDLEALFFIFKDEEVNTYLPWFPLKSMDEAHRFFEEQYEEAYKQPRAYKYAVCLKEDDFPIGYVNVSMEDSHDFGYGLRKEFWHKGITTEAGQGVIRQLTRDKLPYVTATHDVRNVRSGQVMKRLGMTYQYSYEEQWQPKDFPVTFRMYQLNLNGDKEFVYRKYWEISKVRFVEHIAESKEQGKETESKSQAEAGEGEKSYAEKID